MSDSRNQGNGCPCCGRDKVVRSNCLATTNPELAAQWHPTKNGEVTPEQVVAGANKKYWWKCPEGDDHEWQAVCSTRERGAGCPCCRSLKVVRSNCLATTNPELAAQWHPTKNGDVTPEQVVAGSNKKYWWICPEADDHEWEAPCYVRQQGHGCPKCNLGWTISNIRKFVQSLLDQKLLEVLTPAELWTLFQQNGLLNSYGTRRASLVKAITTGRIPREKLEDFAGADDDNPSELDAAFGDATADDVIARMDETTVGSIGDDDEIHDADTSNLDTGDTSQPALPEVSATSVLDAAESKVWSSADEEAVDFLVASGVAKLWRAAYNPDQLRDVKAQTRTRRSNEFSERIRRQFRQELDAAQSLHIPDGYAFTVNGHREKPTLILSQANPGWIILIDA